MVLAESWRSAHCEYVFDLRTSPKLSANNLGLALNASEGRDNEQRNTVLEGFRFEIAPSNRGSMNQQMFPTVGSYFDDFKTGCFLALALTARRQELT